MRQSLWRTPGKTKGDPKMDDETPAEVTDAVLWGDTDVILADPLTKRMDVKKLWGVLERIFSDMN